MGQELPDSWASTTISEVADINPGIDKSQLDDRDEVTFVPMPAVEAGTGKIDVSATRKFADVRSGFTPFATGDVLFAKITPCMENGKMAIVPQLPKGVGFGSTEFHVLRAKQSVDPSYLYYFVSSSSVRHEAQHQMTGAVGQKRVPKRYLETKLFPLPPLEEQHRIVEKIETLFAQLDQGEASLRSVQTLLTRYRQSVLKAAVTGQLTADWRAENAHRLEHGRDLLQRILQTRRDNWQGRGKYKEPAEPDTSGLPELPEGWVWASTDQLAYVETGATPKKGNPEFYAKVGIPWITSTAVNDEVIFQPQAYITENALQKTNAKVFPTGSLIVAMYGEGKTRGKVSELGIDAATNQACAALRVEHLSSSLKRYLRLFYQFNYEAIRLLSSGGVQPNLNLSLVKQTAVPIPSETEIREIVERIDVEMQRLKYTEMRCDAELTRSTALRQSILKDAFAGRLVPQDPNDEPAAALLARIRAERDAATKPAARGRGKAGSANAVSQHAKGAR